VEHGYAAATVQQIAAAAGVAVRTVFNAYPGGKAQIFDEALDVALGGDETRRPLAERPITELVVAERDGRLAVQRLVQGAGDLYDRAAGLITTYLESAGADPHMRRHADRGAEEAARIMQGVARSLAEHGALRRDLSVERAGDVLLALCSPHVHHLLRRRCGWSSTAYRTWLADTLERALLR
jgi:AcrR family transcriptional regulator